MEPPARALTGNCSLRDCAHVTGEHDGQVPTAQVEIFSLITIFCTFLVMRLLIFVNQDKFPTALSRAPQVVVSRDIQQSVAQYVGGRTARYTFCVSTATSAAFAVYAGRDTPRATSSSS